MDNQKTPVKPQQSSELKTVVGKGTVIEGKLSIQSSGRIDGIVKGEVIVTDSVVIGEDGEITGDVVCDRIVIAGKVDGNVYATNQVNLESRAVLKGDLVAPRVTIEEGSFFNGSCKMIQSKEIIIDKQSQSAQVVELSPEEILTSR